MTINKEVEPFHIMSGDQAIFDPFTKRELEILLEHMVAWEHYQSASKVKKALDKRK